MKNLLITGVYQANIRNIFYKVYLYGQCSKVPDITYIGELRGFYKDIDHLKAEAKHRYNLYFNKPPQELAPINVIERLLSIDHEHATLYPKGE